MEIQFVKNDCCLDAGKIVAETSGAIHDVIDNLIAICTNQMGDDCIATIWPHVAAVKGCWGVDAPLDLIAAFDTAVAGVLESSNGGPAEYLPLPKKHTQKYYQVIFDDLTNCDWGDCHIVIKY